VFGPILLPVLVPEAPLYPHDQAGIPIRSDKPVRPEDAL